MKNFFIGLCVAGMLSPVGMSAAGGDIEMERFISSLLEKMTLEEKVGLLGSMLNVCGVKETRKFQEAAMKSRLKIPMLFGMDVIHGFRTGFPLPLAEAASFDLEAIKMGARCSAREAAAAGLHWTFAPMVDIGWDARWGRVMEGAGEDPYYGAKVAAARVCGLQGDDLSADSTILACIKHFVGYGAVVAGKDYNSVDMSWGHFANFYMPPYKAGVEAGAATVMSAFNDFENRPCTGNEDLLRGLLKEKWGFQGFVVSDWGSVGEMVNHRYAKDQKEAANKAIMAGLDMEMVSECYAQNLADLVREKKVPEALLDDAVRRILEQKYKLGLFDDPFRYCNEERERTVIGAERSRREARYMAERSVVLLKNEGAVLPLASSVRRVALIGGLSKSQKDMCGSWTCADESKVVTLYEAMQERGVEVDFHEGYDLESNEIKDLKGTLKAARRADVVVVAMGERSGESGEMTSKGDISIPEQQQRLVTELVKTGKPVIVLMMCGRPVIFNEVRQQALAILCTWWLGSEAGPAICNVLWGDYNPSGKLPMTFPSHLGQLPLYYQYKSTGRPYANSVWCAKYIDIPSEPAYPFAFGLSYTTFEYSALKVLPGDGGKVHARVRVEVKNTGRYEGEEVVQLYVRDEAASITRPVKELKGFEKIALKPGESKEVVFDITDEQLGFYDNRMNFVVEKGDFTFMVGTNSRDVDSVSYTLL